MTYKVYDGVSDETLIFDNYDDLKGYAEIWKDRLNNERFPDEGAYDISTYDGIIEVFEVCNIHLKLIA